MLKIASLQKLKLSHYIMVDRDGGEGLAIHDFLHSKVYSIRHVDVYAHFMEVDQSTSFSTGCITYMCSLQHAFCNMLSCTCKLHVDTCYKPWAMVFLYVKHAHKFNFFYYRKNKFMSMTLPTKVAQTKWPMNCPLKCHPVLPYQLQAQGPVQITAM